MKAPRAIGLALAMATTLLVLVNQRDVGIARDETVYMSAGERYAAWWVDLVTFRARPTIAQTFGGANGGANNPEHPPLMKLAAGLSHRWVPWVDELTAFRIPSAVLDGICAWLVFAMTLELWGLAEAMIATLCLMLLPRAVFHAGLDCFDAPTMALWFATVFAYWRCLDGRKWPWQVGVAWGLALATKHTALLLPFALAAHYAVIAWRARAGASYVRTLVTYRPRVAISLAVLGPLVLFALWPWLWLDPIGHVHAWLAFHANHVHYNFEYLGHNWNAPRFPWHVALVTTLFTVPTATIAAAITGGAVWIVRWRRGAVLAELSRSGGEPVLAELPRSGGEPVLAELPRSGGEPVLAELSRSGGEPVVAELPRSGGEPVVAELPRSGGEPVVAELPRSGGEPVVAELPRSGGEPVVAELPRSGGEPVVDRAPALLLALSAAASIGPFFLGTTPIFGAEKHWMPILPTLCIAAGVGAAWAARRAASYVRSERVALAIVGGAIVLAGAVETATAEPYALTWYSALAGGAPGGADLGMNRQFWGVAVRGVIPIVARQLPGPIYTHDASPAWGWYQRLGLLPKGYPDSGWETAGIAASKLALVIHEKHFNRHDYLIWKAYGTVQPIFVLRSDGVPIVSVYKRP